MHTAELLAEDLAALEELTFEELFTQTSDDEDPQAIMCACCCTSCGC